MSDTGSSEIPTLSSDSSLDTMLSAAVVTREVTTSDSSGLSDSVREGLAADFDGSSDSEITVDDTEVTGHAENMTAYFTIFLDIFCELFNKMEQKKKHGKYARVLYLKDARQRRQDIH